MKSCKFVFFLVFLFELSLQAKSWNVGPTRIYTKPSQVSTLVANGDLVLVDAGIYDNDVCKWSANNLTLRGVGGFAHLRANGNNFGGKAIWVIAGKNTLVDSIEFSLCACIDKNGAGIRQEGSGLTVTHCYFHDNENGILCGADTSNVVDIRHCEFYNNGAGDGYSHNLYIGHIKKLNFLYNYSHHTKVGHELKSRANINIIQYNRFDDGTDGTASRSIDLPNGGVAVLVGNEMIKGPQSQNSNLVEFGLEGLTNLGPHQFYFVNNTLVNQRSLGNFITLIGGVDKAVVKNNIFAGNGVFTFNTPTILDSANNVFGTLAQLKFTGVPNQEYELSATSPAVNIGKNAGLAGTYSLFPNYEYKHIANFKNRVMYNNLDAGAHEYGGTTSNIAFHMGGEIFLYPNPTNSTGFYFKSEELGLIEVYDGLSQKMGSSVLKTSTSDAFIPTENLANGIYKIKFTGNLDSSIHLLLMQQ